jgi:membrane protease YdiL (CAAX protease family)
MICNKHGLQRRDHDRGFEGGSVACFYGRKNTIFERKSMLNDKQRILFVSSIVLLPFTFALFQLTTLWLGPRWGYFTGFVGYWAYCLVTAWLLSGSDWNYFKAMWTREADKSAKWISLVAFIPVFGVFFVSFLPNVSRLTLSTGALLTVTVLLNGAIEELYWRGLYLLEYPKDGRIGFFVSLLLFAAWHVSLWFARGVIYKDGFLALVGGAFGLGLIWTWVARSNRNLRAVVPSHILVNLFALTALFVDNGF